MRITTRALLVALAVVTAASAHVLAAGGRHSSGWGKHFRDQERLVQRARTLTRRVLRDRNTADEIKRQASDLDGFLERRRQKINRLAEIHEEFIARHEQELDELDSLRKRALDIDRKLRADRDALLQAHQGEIDEIKRESQQAVSTLETLRADYNRYRRERKRDWRHGKDGG